jgi:hypothetical protein
LATWDQAGAATDWGDVAWAIAPDAMNLARFELGGPGVRQISYFVERRYPEKGVADEKISALVENGWQRCESHRSGWEDFIDGTTSPPTLVHQSLTTLRKFNAEYVVVTLRYGSKWRGHKDGEVVPDNSLQQVVILHYDLSVPEIREQMASTLQSCPVTNSGSSH